VPEGPALVGESEMTAAVEHTSEEMSVSIASLEHAPSPIHVKRETRYSDRREVIASYVVSSRVRWSMGAF
jgi:hypothetical protein